MADQTFSPQDERSTFEKNRNEAKARVQRTTTHNPNSNPTTQAPNESAAKPTAAQRKRRAIDLNYCEYNFSTMKDTKGGFILEEQDLPDSKKQRQEEKNVIYDPPVDLVLENNSLCETCQSIDLDQQYLKHFRVRVCRSCREKHPEKYSLLTKTECREDYLLTDSELRDTSRLPHWERPNPHKSTYSNMLLYLRSQVEAFAWEKWGSPEALDAEFERREAEKKERKERKFKAKLNELRKKTRTSTWQKKVEQHHIHQYGESVKNLETDEYSQTCLTCGVTTTYESI